MLLRAGPILLLSTCLAAMPLGCGARQPVPRSPADAQLFAPVSMRIHPIFTQVKDWTGDGSPDGIEALLEFQDQFSDPTKAAGTVIFELYGYDRRSPSPRGERLVNPWVGSLKTLAEQQARWNRTSRTYFFQLDFSAVREEESYVLVASFDTGTTRFFDEVVLEGDRSARDRRSPAPAAAPAPSPAPAASPAREPAPSPTTAPRDPPTIAETAAPAAGEDADVAPAGP